jgi:hypothetical protein
LRSVFGPVARIVEADSPAPLQASENSLVGSINLLRPVPRNLKRKRWGLKFAQQWIDDGEPHLKKNSPSLYATPDTVIGSDLDCLSDLDLFHSDLNSWPSIFISLRFSLAFPALSRFASPVNIRVRIISLDQSLVQFRAEQILRR